MPLAPRCPSKLRNGIGFNPRSIAVSSPSALSRGDASLHSISPFTKQPSQADWPAYLQGRKSTASSLVEVLLKVQADHVEPGLPELSDLVRRRTRGVAWSNHRAGIAQRVRGIAAPHSRSGSSTPTIIAPSVAEVSSDELHLPWQPRAPRIACSQPMQPEAHPVQFDLPQASRFSGRALQYEALSDES